MLRRKQKKHGELTDGKKEIISKLLEEYDVQSAEDIQSALEDLLGGTIKGMMEAEMQEHLGYEKSAGSDITNARNGYKRKKIRSSYGEIDLSVPQDRESSFEPKIVPKREKDISQIDQRIIAMYARGMSTRQISEEIEEIYGFDVSESFVSNVTDKILPEIEEWQKQTLKCSLSSRIYRCGSSNLRKVIYTTNAIESLNSTYKKPNRQRRVFPSDSSLLKALYLATNIATKKWKSPLKNWAKVYGEFQIMVPDRMPE